MSKDRDKYEVGYKKPPKHTRFGQIGGNPQNKSGRPAGRNVQEFGRLSEEALWNCFSQIAQKPMKVTEDDQERLIPYLLALVTRMANDAIKGDHKARKEFLHYVEKAAKGADSLQIDVHMAMFKIKERRLLALQNPGSQECFKVFYEWFMVKKELRTLDGPEKWPYEAGEPVTDDDWDFFLEHFELFATDKDYQAKWPVKYPADIKADRIDKMSKKERAEERLSEFQHRRQMREKFGIAKWPIMVEEPVDERDWEHFKRHIQDILNDAENPAPWPPTYWDEEPQE